MEKKDILKWTKALRSGKYKQTRLTLEDDVGYCCLGVACELFIPKNKLEKDEDGFLAGGSPDGQDAAPKWLQDIDHEFGLLAGDQLSFLNDDEDFTFDEIADCLEAVYIHEVLG